MEEEQISAKEKLRALAGGAQAPQQPERPISAKDKLRALAGGTQAPQQPPFASAPSAPSVSEEGGMSPSGVAGRKYELGPLGMEQLGGAGQRIASLDPSSVSLAPKEATITERETIALPEGPVKEAAAEVVRRSDSERYRNVFGSMDMSQVEKAGAGLETSAKSLDREAQRLKWDIEQFHNDKTRLDALRAQAEASGSKEDVDLYNQERDALMATAFEMEKRRGYLEDLERSLLKDATMLSDRKYDILKNTGSWGGAASMALAKGAGSMASGVAGAELTAAAYAPWVLDNMLEIATAGPAYILGGEELAKKAYDLFQPADPSKRARDWKTGALDSLREAPVGALRKVGLDTTQEYYDDANRSFLGASMLGLVQSIPAMLTPGMVGIAAQTSDAMAKELEDPRFDDIAEGEKFGLQLAMAVPAMLLERFGFRNLARNSAVTKRILASAVSKLPANASAGQIQRVLDAETRSIATNIAVKGLGGALSEAETGGAQQLTEDITRQIYDGLKGRDLIAGEWIDGKFYPTTIGDMVTNTMEGAAMEAVGGLVMSVPFAIGAAIRTDGVIQKMDKRRFEMVDRMMRDPDYEGMFGARIEAEVKAGSISQVEADKVMDDLRYARSIFEQVPEDLDIEKKKKAVDLIRQREELSRRDKNLVGHKVAAINDELKKLVGVPVEGQAASAKEADADIAGSPKFAGDDTGAAKSDAAQTGAVRDPGGLRGGAVGILPEDEAPLDGSPKTVRVPGRGEVVTGPLPQARAAARDYAKSAGIDYRPPRKYVKVQPDRSRRIADEFDRMQHAPNDPEVRAAYDAMIKETLDQFQAIKKTGLKIDFIEGGKGDPYALSPRLAELDVKENNHLWVFPTTEGFGEGGMDVSDSPMLAPTNEEINGRKLLVNDVFRIVHDYFGHVKDGVGFRADGEENAWRSHSAMYSPLARRAMTTETRGQNSWVNYGPHGDQNRGAVSGETIYAEQKVGLLPQWVVDEGRMDETPQDVDTSEDFTTSDLDEAISEEVNASDTGVMEQRSGADQAFNGTEKPSAPIGDTKTVMVDGKERTVFNSTGKPIHPTVEGVRNFWRWFGDSKVVDGEGRPLVVYHVGSASIDAFRVPAYFTSDAGYAKRLRQGSEYPVYLNISKPLDLFKYNEHVKSLGYEARFGGPFMVSDEHIGNSYGVAGDKWRPTKILVENLKGGEILDRFEQDESTADGVIGPESGFSDDVTTYVALSPGQIKSATGNYGTFDPSSPSITQQRTASGQPSTSRKNISNVISALRKVAPGLKVIVHKTPEGFAKASADAGGRGLSSDAAFWDPKTNEIHINEKEAGDNTLFHEAAHPVLVAALKENPDLLLSFYSELADDPAFARYIAFGEGYADKGDLVVAAEAIVEFMADVAAGKVPVSTRPDSLWQKFKRFISDLLNKLGFDVRSIDLSKPKNVREFAGRFAEAMRTGIKIGGLPQVSRSMGATMQQDVDALVDGWYSRLDQAVVAKGNTQSGADWLKWAEARAKEGLLSMEEVKWTGLADFLQGKAKVTPKEVRDFLKENRVKVEVKELRDEEVIGAELDKLGYRQEQDMGGDMVVINNATDEVVDYDDLPKNVQQIIDSSDQLTKFSQYQLHGGANYREVLVTLPRKRTRKKAVVRKVGDGPYPWKVFAGDATDGNHASSHRTEEEAMEAARTDFYTTEKEKFRSSHFPDVVNPLLHLRLNDRTGPNGEKILFIEELQSDWGQQGKKKGFADDGKYKAPQVGKFEEGWAVAMPDGEQASTVTYDTKEALLEDHRLQWERDKKLEQDPDSYSATKVPSNILVNGERQPDVWQVKRKKAGYHGKTHTVIVGNVPYAETEDEAISRVLAQKKQDRSGVPSAPFVTSTDAWVELGLKQAIRMAVEGGYDRIAWTTGEQQAYRYSLTNKVKWMSWAHALPTSPLHERGAKVIVDIQPKGNLDHVQLEVDANGVVLSGKGILGGRADGKRLDEVIGKEVADRIMSDETGHLEGDGLKIGGTGMKGFYDKILPSVAKKVSKKLGGDGVVSEVKVGEARREEQEDEAGMQQSIAITPEMRQRVSGGVPLMQRPASVTPDAYKAALQAVKDASKAGASSAEALDAGATTFSDPAQQEDFRKAIIAKARQMAAQRAGKGANVTAQSQGSAVSNEFKEVRDQILSDAKAFKAGAKAGIKEEVELRKEFAQTLRERLKGLGAKVGPQQVAAMVSRATKTSPRSARQVNALLKYMDKVMANAEYAQKEQDARKLRKGISRMARVKAKQKRDAMLNAVASRFAKLNIAHIEDIDQYLSIAQRLSDALSGPRVKVQDDVVMAKNVDYNITNREVSDYIDMQMEVEKDAEEQEIMMAFEEMRSSLGLEGASLSMAEIKAIMAAMEGDDASLEKARAIADEKKKMMRTMASLKVEDLKQAVKDGTVQLDEEKQKMVDDLSAIDTSRLSPADAARLITAVDNVIVNDRWGGVRDLGAIGRKDMFFSDLPSNVKGGVGKPGAESVLFNITDTVATMAEKIAKGVKAAAWLRKAMGLDGAMNAIAAAWRITDGHRNERSKLAKGLKYKDSKLNRFRMGVYAYMIQHRGGTAEDMAASFERRKNNLLESLENIKNGTAYRRMAEDADLYERAVNEVLGDATDISGLKLADNMKKLVEHEINFFRGEMEEMTQRGAEFDHNKLLQLWENYTPQSQTAVGASGHVDEDRRRLDRMMTGKKGVDADPASAKMERTETLRPGHAIDLDFFNVVDRSLFESASDNLGARHLATLREVLTDPRAVDVFGSDTQKMLVERVKSILGLEGQKMDNMDRLGSELYHKLARRSAGIALKGVLQAPKQMTVGLSTLVALKGDVALLSSSYGDAVKSMMDIDSWQYQLIKDQQIHERGKTIAGIEKLGATVTKDPVIRGDERPSVVQLKKFASRWGIAADKLEVSLALGDVISARAAYFAFYKQALKEKGVDLNSDGWKTSLDKDAASYANQMVERQQNANTSQAMAEVYKGRGARKVIIDFMFAFSSFAMNQRKRMARDLAIMRNGSKEDRAYAAVDLSIAIPLETLAYSAMAYGVAWLGREVVGRVMAEALLGAGDDDDEKKDSRRRSAGEEIAIRAIWDYLFTGTPDVIGNKIKSPLNDMARSIDGKDLFYVRKDGTDLGVFGAGVDDLTNLYTGTYNYAFDQRPVGRSFHGRELPTYPKPLSKDARRAARWLAIGSFLSLAGVSDQTFTRPFLREARKRMEAEKARTHGVRGQKIIVDRPPK